MAQKRVSVKVAKAIKEAGYPQYGSCEEFYTDISKAMLNEFFF